MAERHSERLEQLDAKRQTIERENARVLDQLRSLRLLPRSSEVKVDALEREAEVARARLAVIDSEANALRTDTDLVLRALVEAREAAEYLNARRSKLLARFVRGSFVVQLIELPLISFLIAGDNYWGSVNLDFYVAATTIFPVLVVAGFLEIRAAAGPAVAWQIAAFSLPTVSGTAASLVALAIHRSTAVTAFLTISGLSAATFVLMVNAIANAALDAD